MTLEDEEYECIDFEPDAKHYKSAESFKCINHPEIELQLSQVNDDYCDCPDGSDEPGTSACSAVKAADLAIPGFYCKNKGVIFAECQLSDQADYSRPPTTIYTSIIHQRRRMRLRSLLRWQRRVDGHRREVRG